MSPAPIPFLLRCWLAELVPVLVLGCLLLLPVPVTVLFVLVPAVAANIAFSRWLWYGNSRPTLWVWRLSRRVVRCHAVRSDRVSLLFPAGLDGTIDHQEVIRWAESDLDDLAQRFAVRFRGRATVVLVPSQHDIKADFGRPTGGMALTHVNAVVLAADCPVRRLLRHELVHVFAARWNAGAPPLVQEGLAVWLENVEGDGANSLNDTRSVCLRDIDPAKLLDRRYFFGPDRVHDCYAMAGEFTGFLVRRFGWDRYRRFYRKVDRWTLRSLFRREFGVRLEEGWRRYGDEAFAMASLLARRRRDALFNVIE